MMKRWETVVDIGAYTAEGLLAWVNLAYYRRSEEQHQALNTAYHQGADRESMQELRAQCERSQAAQWMYALVRMLGRVISVPVACLVACLPVTMSENLADRYRDRVWSWTSHPLLTRNVIKSALVLAFWYMIILMNLASTQAAMIAFMLHPLSLALTVSLSLIYLGYVANQALQELGELGRSFRSVHAAECAVIHERPDEDFENFLYPHQREDSRLDREHYLITFAAQQQSRHHQTVVDKLLALTKEVEVLKERCSSRSAHVVCV